MWNRPQYYSQKMEESHTLVPSSCFFVLLELRVSTGSSWTLYNGIPVLLTLSSSWLNSILFHAWIIPLWLPLWYVWCCDAFMELTWQFINKTLCFRVLGAQKTWIKALWECLLWAPFLLQGPCLVAVSSHKGGNRKPPRTLIYTCISFTKRNPHNLITPISNIITLAIRSQHMKLRRLTLSTW